MSQLKLRIGPQSAVAGASILESEIVYAFDSETFWSANESGAKINLNPISVWKPAVLRIVGCVVERNGILFRCTAQHTSSTDFDTDAANWTLVTKPPVRVVTNIANRDLITGFNLFEGLGCYVLDATGDVTVTTGAAFYVYTGSAWDKLSEFESLDVTIDDASETAKGILELATQAEVDAGTDDVRAVTPLKLRTVTGDKATLSTTVKTSLVAAINELVSSKANLSSPTFTGNVAGITKAMVGLGNVDDTSDANKPVSTATSDALALKLNITDANTALNLKADKFDVGTRTSLFDFDASSASYLSLNWMLDAQGGTYYADCTFNGGSGYQGMDGSFISVAYAYCNGKFGRAFSTSVALSKFRVLVGTEASNRRLKDFSIYVKTGGVWYISNDPVLNGNFNFSVSGGTDMGNAIYRMADSDTAITTLSCANSAAYEGYAIRPISGYDSGLPTIGYLREFEAYQIDLAAVPSPNTNCVNSINNVYGKLVNLPARTDSSVAVSVLASDRLVRINATGAGASQTVTLPLISSVANGKIITLTGIGTSTYPAAINPGSGNTILGGNLTFNENGQSATLVANLVNSQWEVISHSKPSVINVAVKNNYAGTAAPTAANDQTQGYAPGSVWLDATSTPKETYRCAVATTGAAIWLKTSLTYDELPSSRAVTSHSSASGNITYPTTTKMLVITMTGSSNVQVTFGASAGYPDEIKIKRLGSGTGVITILPNGVETIDGVAGLFAANPYVGSSGDLLAMEPVTSGFILA